MVFQDKFTATVIAKLSGSVNTITIAGTNPEEESPENAAAQINKILAPIQKSVVTKGMIQRKDKEAVEGE